MLKGNWGSRDKAPYILSLCTTLILRTVISFLIRYPYQGKPSWYPLYATLGRPQSIGCGGKIKIVSSCQELNNVHPEGGAFYWVGYTDRLSCAFPTNICTILHASFNLPCLWA